MSKHYFVGGGFSIWLIRVLIAYFLFAGFANLGSIIRGEHVVGSAIFTLIFGALIWWDLRILKRYVASQEGGEFEDKSEENLNRIADQMGSKLKSVRERAEEKRSARVSPREARIAELEREYHETRRKRESYYHQRTLSLADQAQMDQLAAHESFLSRELEELRRK